MEKLKALMAHWRTVEPKRVTLATIKQDERYQPRNLRVVPYADRPRAEAASEAHIVRLSEVLEDGDVEPLLVADFDGRLVIVDGHHRWKAYRRAGKKDSPARVLKVTPKDALMVSKLVNCDGVKLAMHDEQCRECAWQYLADATLQGKLPLPKGTSQRAVGRTFGTSRETIGSMLRKLSAVNPADYSDEACDPGTGWPQWKYVKGNAIRERYQNIPENLQELHKTERMAGRLASMIEKHGMARFLSALQLLEHERQDEASMAAERLAQAGENDHDDD